ncbi:hypothetical protein [Nonomuraea salmonea]|uniref:hypothetical protein n=1 Tax=Nonomuraea salmonea TaxID=46181 RepID=UPI0031EE89DB
MVRLSEVSPATSAVFRCAYAVPPLLFLAWRERRRLGPLPRRALPAAWAAGVAFAFDLLFWHHAIDYVGGRASRPCWATCRCSWWRSRRGGAVR